MENLVRKILGIRRFAALKNGYCIILSKYRLYQGIALYRSLKRAIEAKNSYRVFILCMDKETHSILSKMKLENVTLIQLHTIETNELRLVKNRRKLNEYCWTLKPVFLEHILWNYFDIERVTFLDADLYFLSDPTNIFKRQAKYSVLLSSHDYPLDVKQASERKVGKTNSGIASFKRDETGLTALKWWKKRCQEWCYDRIEGDKFGDQKYLDKLPAFFEDIAYITTPGVNIAPWNEMKYDFSLKNGFVHIGEFPLIIYHFCGFRIRNKSEYSLSLDKHTKPIDIIYDPYSREISKAIADIEKIAPDFEAYFVEEKYKRDDRIFKLKAEKKELPETLTYYGTIVSDKYVFKAITMYHSLVKHGKDFQLFILCVDENAHRIIHSLNLDKVTCIKLQEVEDESLLKVKGNRTKTEYCWTMKPSFLYYLMTNHPWARYYALLDSDFYFFGDPGKIFEENPKAFLYLTDHRNSKRFKHFYEKTGIINSGFVGCKKDDATLKAVLWWKKQCVEWCYLKYDTEGKRYGDQRYLEKWDELFGGVHLVKTIGANVAPWNIESYRVFERDGQVYVDDERLLFYHFSGFSMYNSREFNLSWSYPLEEEVVEHVYTPYIQHLLSVIQEITKLHPGFSQGFVTKGEVPEKHYFRI